MEKSLLCRLFFRLSEKFIGIYLICKIFILDSGIYFVIISI